MMGLATKSAKTFDVESWAQDSIKSAESLAQNAQNIIEVRNLTTTYGKRIIHENLNFSIKKGSIFAILGGSGSGKSTLLRTMLLLHRPKNGQIFMFGRDIWAAGASEKSALCAKCGVMFQFGALFSSMSVGENIGIMLAENSALSADEVRSSALLWLKLVGLNERVYDLAPSELSGGMVKRAALARALALSPKILFLDEPTSGLDPLSAERFDGLIMTLRDMLGLTIVMITHDLDSIKDAVDEFVLLDSGRISYAGNLEGLRASGIKSDLFNNKRGERYL